jgi:hypothetical protein
MLQANDMRDSLSTGAPHVRPESAPLVSGSVTAKLLAELWSGEATKELGEAAVSYDLLWGVLSQLHLRGGFAVSFVSASWAEVQMVDGWFPGMEVMRTGSGLEVAHTGLRVVTMSKIRIRHGMASCVSFESGHSDWQFTSSHPNGVPEMPVDVALAGMVE